MYSEMQMARMWLVSGAGVVCWVALCSYASHDESIAGHDDSRTIKSYLQPHFYLPITPNCQLLAECTTG